MAFRVGQKVVCVDDKHPANPDPMPIAGKVYTIRGFSRADFGEDGLLLEEVATGALHSNGNERGYMIRRFRPIVERKTDISCLKALLVPGTKISEDA